LEGLHALQEKLIDVRASRPGCIGNPVSALAMALTSTNEARIKVLFEEDSIPVEVLESILESYGYKLVSVTDLGNHKEALAEIEG
jgi:hypothetical protein